MFLGVDVADVEARLGVELRELGPEVIAGRRDHADAAPGPVADVEDSEYGLLR